MRAHVRGCGRPTTSHRAHAGFWTPGVPACPEPSGDVVCAGRGGAGHQATQRGHGHHSPCAAGGRGNGREAVVVVAREAAGHVAARRKSRSLDSRSRAVREESTIG